MLRFLFFLIVFYIIFQGLKIFIRAFSKGKQSNSFGKKRKPRRDNRNIEDAEYTEIESKIHTQEKDKVDGEG